MKVGRGRCADRARGELNLAVKCWCLVHENRFQEGES
jgi:hypothetical protein